MRTRSERNAKLFLCSSVPLSSNGLLGQQTMSFLRAASVTAALALVVSSIAGSIPLAGQVGAAAIGRRIERYRGRPVIAGFM